MLHSHSTPTCYSPTKAALLFSFINTVEAREKMYTNWTREMNLYGDHPAILMWSFGNEVESIVECKAGNGLSCQ